MELPAGWATETVRTNGIELRYYRVGDGQPIVMAHGFYDNGRRWVPLADDLANDTDVDDSHAGGENGGRPETYEVVTFDARGHGRSDAPETGYHVDDRVDDLVGLVDELDLEDPILLGHSMGAATVAWTAARHPDLLRALVLEDPLWMHDNPELGPDERAELVSEQLAAAAEQSVDELIDEHYAERDTDQARRLATASHECSPAIAEIAREGYPRALHEILPDVACPTLVLKSDGDTDQRVRDRETAETIPSGRLVHVPDAGHYVFGDQYDTAYAALRSFLGRI